MGDRFAAWCDLMSGGVVPMILESEYQRDFRASTEMRDLGLVQLVRTSYPPLRGRRTAPLIRRSDPELMLLSLNIRGRQVTQRPDREWATDPGGIVINNTSSSATVINTTRVLQLVLQLPRSVLGREERRLQTMSMVTSGGIGGTLAYVMADLARNADQHPPAVVSRLCLTVIDLLNSVARLAAGAREPMSSDATGRIRYLQAVRHILLRLGDPALTAGAVAQALGISTRHLDRLFRAEGASPAEWIRRERLARCQQDLLDPAQQALPVLEVGARWGYPDPTTFSRVFRREFGSPPAEYRRNHRLLQRQATRYGSDPV
ncbi:AraC family transcriptional regulator [Phytohabitans suffuscus]|uniref:HTH araC/xylS-type domain-containing protein n=1 Tax=Phytohabitans suffuscus TaxID=624315 RepID=A0A6F8YAK9_9ACTN|nr:AraC family transcriptional regulator [Phytohabitans suffuscus]BCB83152.1 hypothetical protein Psuf_004650 [Phytohabitans suffuscus]